MSFSSTSALRRRGKDIKPSNLAMDMESIRARRAKLEGILNTMRPPPLTKDSTSLSQPSLLRAGGAGGKGVVGAWPRRRHSSDTHRTFSDPLSIQPLPHMSTMTPYNPPLPSIGKRRETSSELSSLAPSRQSSGKRRTPDASLPENREKRPVTGRSRGSEAETEEEDNDPEDLKYTQATLQEIVKGIGSNSRERRLKNTVRARKLLSIEDSPPIGDFLKAGILSPLIPHLQQEDEATLQFEATWALTNLAAGNSEQTGAVVDGGSVPILINLLRCKTIIVKEQAAWALGNIVGDCQEYRNHVVREGVTGPLLDTLKDVNRKPAPVTLVRVVTWVFAVTSKSSKSPELARLPQCQQIKENRNFKAHKVDALWAVGYISDQDENRIQEVISAGVVSSLIHHLGSGEKQKIAPALRAIGNIATDKRGVGCWGAATVRSSAEEWPPQRQEGGRLGSLKHHRW
ncbi:importin subunit alpha-1a-like [Homarus americanus]|uniref:importin subunit alpha-1a-like n=1 Tax=Homarus americanus TaxID=6706 RepID=UPI001C46B400|nr:importin subunit alpha-1a-like [Homarus americanus]